MLNSRLKYQDIEYNYFGKPSNIPTGKSIAEGDDVILKYKQYDITVERVAIISENYFSGTVGSISDPDSKCDLSEKGDTLNIGVGETIKFQEENIFYCTRNS